MNLSHLTLRRLGADLEPLVGARVREATLAPPNTLYLGFARSGDSPVTRLLVSGSRSQSRICVTTGDFPSSPDRPPWVERYLLNAVLRAVTVQPDDRVVTFALDKQDRVGSRYPSRLVVEMLGRDSNAILVDDTGRIQGLLRPHSTERRRLHPGADFQPPTPQDRRLPAEIPADAFAAALADADTPQAALLDTCAGMDRHLANEVVHRAAETDADMLETVRHLYAEPPFHEPPGCVLSENGRRTAAVPFTPRAVAPDRFEGCETISEAIERVYADSLKGQESQGERKSLRKTLTRALKAALRKRDRIEEDLLQARRADEFERLGSLILANPHDVPAGAASVVLEDLFEGSGGSVEIELNPKQTAVENGQAYLKRAARARKSEPVLARRLGQTEADVAELEKLIGELDPLTEDTDIARFRKKLEDRGLIRPQRPRQRPGKADPSGLHPRRYRTSDGWEVWVGRNDAENDRITKRAPRNAIWFHAHGCPGSHVVLRPRDQREPSPEALHDAACLAAYWSKARGAKTVPVNYTEARYVQKPKGAPPGLVTIRNEKTLFVSPREIERWDRDQA